MSKLNAPQLLKEFKEVFGDKMILSYGTVLWLVRNGHLHQDPHDDEDVIVRAEDLTEERVSELVKRGFIIYHRLPMPNGVIGEISFVKDDQKIDIFVAHRRENEYYWAMYDGSWYFHRLPAKFIDKTEKLEWNDETWLIPSPVEEYLEYTYGDWKKPVDHFDWRFDHGSYDKDFVL